MKVSWEWLGSFVDLKNTNPEDVSDKLTLAGCEIEEIRQTLDGNDYVLDITSTPNRGDLLGMIGIAREICTILDFSQDMILEIEKSLALQERKLNFVNHSTDQSFLSIVNSYCCITELRQKPTPEWLKKHLEASQIEIFNDINDISNYVMLKWGHPVDVINISKLVPVNKQDISFTKETKRQEDCTNKVTEIVYTQIKNIKVGITGVKLEDSYKAIKESQSICLNANLIPTSITRKNSKFCNTRNEYSIRHERGLNKEGLKFALVEAILLIKKIYPEALVGDIYNNIIDRSEVKKNLIKLNINKIRSVLGKIESNGVTRDITFEEVERILVSLGCTLSGKSESLKVLIPPSRQQDLSREIDLIEEIARIQGFNYFRAELPTFHFLNFSSSRNFILKELERKMRSLGMTETIHYSLASQGSGNKVGLDNPLMAEYSYLRTSIIKNLIDSFKSNVKKGNYHFDAFETGRIFLKEDQIIEQEAIAGIFGGKMRRKTWQSSLNCLDWFEGKGILELLLHQIANKLEWRNSIHERYEGIMHPYRSAAIYLHGEYLGVFGQIHPEIVLEKNFPKHVYCFELNLAIIIRNLRTNGEWSNIFKEYSSFPSITRDIAIVIPLETTVASILKIISDQHYPILKETQIFDEYKGKKIEQGKKSIAFRLVYQSNFKTLTTNEVDKVHENIKNKLTQQLNSQFR
nr:SyfB [Porphyrostromium boryanum]